VFKAIVDPSNYFFNPYAIPSLVVGAYCFVLGIFVWVKNKRLLGFSLFTLTFSSGMWLTNAGAVILSKNTAVAFAWNKILYFWVPFIAPSALFFCLCMTKMITMRKERFFLIFSYLVMAFFGLSSLMMDNWLVKMPPTGSSGVLMPEQENFFCFSYAYGYQYYW